MISNAEEEVAENSGEGDLMFEDDYIEMDEDYQENNIYEENGYEENGYYEENGIDEDNCEDGLLSADEFEEVEPSINNHGKVEIIEGEITKRDEQNERDGERDERDGSESSGDSTSDSGTSTTGSDNESGEDDASDSDSFGELEEQIHQEMGKGENKSPKIKRKMNAVRNKHYFRFSIFTS